MDGQLGIVDLLGAHEYKAEKWDGRNKAAANLESPVFVEDQVCSKAEKNPSG